MLGRLRDAFARIQVPSALDAEPEASMWDMAVAETKVSRAQRK